LKLNLLENLSPKIKMKKSTPLEITPRRPLRRTSSNMQTSKSVVLNTGIIFFGLCTIWDLVTSAMGLVSLFGGLKEISSNPFIIVWDLVSKHPTAFVFSLILAGAIVALDFSVFNIIKNGKISKAQPISYVALSLWLPFKYYDFRTTLIGTARCFIEGLKKYPTPSVEEVFNEASNSEQIFVLILMSAIIAASPIVLAYMVDRVEKANE
jgi:hypothetical protein